MTALDMIAQQQKEHAAKVAKQELELLDIDLEIASHKKAGAPYSASRRRELGSLVGGFEL